MQKVSVLEKWSNSVRKRIKTIPPTPPTSRAKSTCRVIKIGRKSLKEEYPKLTNELVLDYIKQFEFNCTILLGFDKWEQGKVFADVNFNQKPVNKSLYYDIFGSYPDPNKNEPGGILEREAALAISNVAIFNPITQKVDKVAIKILEDGKKVRCFKSNGEFIDKV